MLSPDYFNNKDNRIIELFSELENFIIEDIARRVVTSGDLSGTADRMLYKLQQAGESQNAILTKLQSITKLTRKELKKILQEAVIASWNDDVDTLSKLDSLNTSDSGAVGDVSVDTSGTSSRTAAEAVSALTENESVRSVIDAEYKKSNATLENLTRTTMGQANQDLIRLLDEAEIRTASGTQSYTAAANDVLDKYAGQGIVVTYPTGARLTLEAAVRLCVVTSMNQTSAQVTNQYVKEAKCDVVLVSAHLGARVKQAGQPDLAGHDLWQGKVYKIRGSEDGYPNLLESTGYDIDPETGKGTVVNPLGLHGYNCRHSHKPWDKRLRNPYVDENGKLKIDTDENRKMYDLTQEQRAMERSIRKTKRRLVAKKAILDAATGAGRDKIQAEYNALSNKLAAQNKAYNEFCAKNGLAPQYDRTRLADFTREQSDAANAAMKGSGETAEQSTPSEQLTIAESGGIIKTSENISEKMSRYKAFSIDDQNGYEEWVKSYYELNSHVSEKEKEAIKVYTDGSYEAMNAAARFEKGSPEYNKVCREFGEENLDSYLELNRQASEAVSKFKLNDNIITHRYVRSVDYITGTGSAVEDIVNSIGKNYTEKSLMSTSLFDKILRKFGGNTPIHLQILIGKGTNGAYINSFSEKKDLEFEFLLNQNTSFEIIDGGERLVTLQKYDAQQHEFVEVEEMEKYMTLEVIK